MHGKISRNQAYFVVNGNVDAAEMLGQITSMEGDMAAVANGGHEALAVNESFCPTYSFWTSACLAWTGMKLRSRCAEMLP